LIRLKREVRQLVAQQHALGACWRCICCSHAQFARESKQKALGVFRLPGAAKSESKSRVLGAGRQSQTQQIGHRRNPNSFTRLRAHTYTYCFASTYALNLPAGPAEAHRRPWLVREMDPQLALGNGRCLHQVVLGSTPLAAVADSLEVDAQWILANAIANTLRADDVRGRDVVLATPPSELALWQAAVLRHVRVSPARWFQCPGIARSDRWMSQCRSCVFQVLQGAVRSAVATHLHAALCESPAELLPAIGNAVASLPERVGEVAVVIPDFGAWADEACTLPSGEIGLADAVCALPRAHVTRRPAAAAATPASAMPPTIRIRCVCLRVRSESVSGATALLRGERAAEHTGTGAESLVWAAAGSVVCVGSMQSGASSAASGVMAVEERGAGAATVRCPFLLTEAKIQLHGVSA
jgi:hypothetical protein